MAEDNSKPLSDSAKKKMLIQIRDAAKAILTTGHNPVIRCVDKENEKKIEAELALRKQKEAALEEAERKLEDYQRGILNRA